MNAGVQTDPAGPCRSAKGWLVGGGERNGEVVFGGNSSRQGGTGGWGDV